MRPYLIALALAGSCAAVAQDAAFPPYVTAKTLYAKNDYRGKQAPAMMFGTWLKGVAPKTAGKVVLIDFWASWCPPCRELIPELNGFQQEFKDKLVIIGLSDEKAETVKSFMQKTPMDYNIAVDTAHTMSGVVGVKGIPHVLVISPDGIVRWQGFPLDEKDPLTKEKLGQIIAASKVSTPPPAKN